MKRSNLDPPSSRGAYGANRGLTLKDVARLAGVSAATVSMALSDHPRISDRTKAVVRSAAEKLNYVPNSLGRGLRSQRVGSIALVVPQSSQHVFSHPYFMEVLQGISEVTNAHDLTLIVSTAPPEDEDRAYLRLLHGRRADGMIVAAAAIRDRNIDRLAFSDCPLVLLGRYPRDPEVPTVGVDDHRGAELAVAHLAERHHRRRIAHIAAPTDHQAGLDRLQGYQAALGRCGIVYDQGLVVEGDVSEESGEQAARSLVAAGVEFDALFVGNDEMAVGAIRALAAGGRRVPDDVAVIGFDDVRLAAVVRPALTTIRQPMRDTARLAATRLLDILDGQSPEPRQLVLPTELVVRSSCGCGSSSEEDLPSSLPHPPRRIARPVP